MKLKKMVTLIPIVLLLVGCGAKNEETTKSSSVSSTENSMKVSSELQESKEIESEKERVEKEKIAVLEDISDAAKYEEAYQNYSMQNNPKGVEQRGSSPINRNTLNAAGLTQEEYTPIMWGIYDYYGAAVEESELTQERADELQAAAFENLKNGTYAKREIVKVEEVTLENAKDLAQQFVDEEMPNSPLLIDPEIDENGNFKIPYQNSAGTGGNGYIVITKDRYATRYFNSGEQASEPTYIE